ncbi:unnamed protein product [Colias eurytheme]|nr:unnamed protein product [Colias eurytheme]
MEVIVLTECWSKEGVPPPNLIDYNVYYTNKYLNQNDGVVVYVKKSLEAVSAEPEMVDASHGLELGVTCPTRLNNCLDHFMVKTTDEWQTMVFPPLTDHSPILLQIRNNKIARLKTDLSIQVLDYPLALEKISLIDWTQYFSLRDVNHCAECLVSNISGIIKECTTVKYLSKKKAPLKPWITTGVVRSIHSYEIGKIINELKASSAPGLDGISSRLIKEAKEFLIGPLEYLCNLSLEQGQFPDIFKKAIVSPIYKSEDKKM